MSGDLKVGDVCVIRIPDFESRCPTCQALNGKECTIVADARMALRRGCSAIEMGAFYACDVAGRSMAFLHRAELEKKDPPKDDATPRVDFTPCRPAFREELRRHLDKTKVST